MPKGRGNANNASAARGVVGGERKGEKQGKTTRLRRVYATRKFSVKAPAPQKSSRRKGEGIWEREALRGRGEKPHKGEGIEEEQRRGTFLKKVTVRGVGCWEANLWDGGTVARVVRPSCRGVVTLTTKRNKRNAQKRNKG